MRKKANQFTLIELLVVIAILVILVGILVPVLGQASAKAKETKCRGLLDQQNKAAVMYRDEYDESMPFWLSNLYQNYLNDMKLYVCPMDESSGHDGGRPGGEAMNGEKDLIGPEKLSTKFKNECEDKYPEVDDTEFNTTGVAAGYDRDTRIKRCSYFYEFSGAKADASGPLGAHGPAGWGACVADAPTWNEAKTRQLRFGYGSDTAFCTPSKPWDYSLFPTIRCVYHYHALMGQHGKVINAAYDGSTFFSGYKWEDGTWN